MSDQAEREMVAIRLDICPEGPVLEPLEPPDERTRRCFPGWETPLAPWGGFRLSSGLAVVSDGGRKALEWAGPERALVAGQPRGRDCSVVAEVKPIDAAASPHADRADCSEALVGIVFRVETSRRYYQFGIEGRRRAVLYRRRDDEWLALAEQAVEVPGGWLKLEVDLDGDGIRCRCEGLGVELFATDTAFREGRAGVRAIGRARLALLRILRTRAQQARDARRERALAAEERERGKAIPDPVLVRSFKLAELGGTPLFSDFARRGRHDLLIAGETLTAATVDGETLWESPNAFGGIVFSASHVEGGRLIYAFAGERRREGLPSVTGAPAEFVVADELCVIRGLDGKVLAAAKLPPFDDAVQRADFSPASGNLTGSGGDIIVREWRRDCGNGGLNLWAYDRGLNLLWHRRVETPYGHHEAVQFFDVDGDGRDEVLAGGTLFDAEGNVLWQHDLAAEMAAINGAGHYDAVALGRFAGEEEPPVAFLLGGSAGVYVVDAFSGQTRMVHRVGHAQGRFVGRVRGDLPGEQVLVACRWGNMGILTLFSGRGERLWSIQPDWTGQGTCPVAWGGGEPKLLWANTSGPVQAFFDGEGRRVKPLPQLRRLWGGRMRRDVATRVVRLGTEPGDLLCVVADGMMYVYGPAGGGR